MQNRRKSGEEYENLPTFNKNLTALWIIEIKCTSKIAEKIQMHANPSTTSKRLEAAKVCSLQLV